MNKLNVFTIIILTLVVLITIFSTSIILLKKNFTIRHSITRSILDNFDRETLIFAKRFFYVHEFKDYDKKIQSGYNVVFLPDTQSIKIDLKNKNVHSLLDPKSRVGSKLKIEQFKDNIFLIHSFGEVSYFKKDDLLNESQDILKDKKIKSNLKSFSTKIIYDGKIHNQKIYVSILADRITNFAAGDKELPYMEENCEQFTIMVADLNFEYLNFKEFSTFKHICGSDRYDFYEGTVGGVLSVYEHNGLEGLIFSTFNPEDGVGANSYLERINNKNLLEQSEESLAGKIVFIDFKNKDLTIFSKGHRNIIGIHTHKDTILVTENGPRGGDEINKIEYGKNYGWPIASYGETYGAHNDEFKYAKSHSSYGFKEPIYAFVPSLGISQIIKLPNEFSKDWVDNYLIGTLADRHLMRVKFDDKFKKIIFNERILIGERIRDIEYIHDLNIILLSFDNDTLAVLKKIPHN